MAAITIDNYDASVYALYAVRTQMIEQINRQYKLDQASSVAPSAIVMDIYPRMTEIDILLGMAAFAAPWAYFFAPKKFRRIRRSPFSFSRIAPSLGSLEEQEEKLAMLESIQCNTKQEEEEKSIIFGCLDQVGKINDWLSFIVGRIGQFLQG